MPVTVFAGLGRDFSDFLCARGASTDGLDNSFEFGFFVRGLSACDLAQVAHARRKPSASKGARRGMKRGVGKHLLREVGAGYHILKSTVLKVGQLLFVRIMDAFCSHVLIVLRNAPPTARDCGHGRLAGLRHKDCLTAGHRID